MPKNDIPTEKQVVEQEVKPQPEEAQTTIRWNGANMRTTYANVCNVSSTREEMTLLFGTNQSWYAGQKELAVELSDRILLNPFTAKRLALLLNHTITEYENRFGALVLEGGETPAE